MEAATKNMQNFVPTVVVDPVVAAAPLAVAAVLAVRAAMAMVPAAAVVVLVGTIKAFYSLFWKDYFQNKE